MHVCVSACVCECMCVYVYVAANGHLADGHEPILGISAIRHSKQQSNSHLPLSLPYLVMDAIQPHSTMICYRILISQTAHNKKHSNNNYVCA